MIESLGYVGLHSVNLEGWRDFASQQLGMQVVDQTGSPFMKLRMDKKAQRYMIEKSPRSGLAFLGFEVADEAALKRLGAHLAAQRIELRSATEEEIALRSVANFAWVIDPDGHRIEFYHSLKDASQPFKPGRPIGGFRTDRLGMGHVVLLTPAFDAMSRFYRQVLKFGLSDFHREPFPAEFLHVNSRHHSLALIGSEDPPGIHHLMCEYRHFDDVGRAYDIALAKPESIGVSLGRHLNDHVTSFYARTPDEFLIEIGWAGRLIDREAWVPEELASPSLWGHVRYWLPPEKRARANEAIKAVGALGVRAPVEVTRSDAFCIRDK